MKPVLLALSIVLIVVGAVISYGARKWLEKFYKRPYDEKEISILKSIGLLTVLIGAVLLFVVGR